MANVLPLLFKKFINTNDRWRDGTSSTAERILWKRRSRENLYRLINHLKKMMLGYENEQVHGLVNEMEVMAQEIAWDETGEQIMDNMLPIIEKLYNIRYGLSLEVEEIVVGFDDEVETLLDQLTQTSIKQFQVISIAGMAGLGKTTLARRLYRDPLIEYHFDIRAWTCVSQVYSKRNLLLGLISSFIYDLTEINQLRDEQLGEKLYRLLKDRRYLVVLDDIWDCTAWNDLKMYFPDDKVGSRVVFTSRDIDISLRVVAATPAHVLRVRSIEESWCIFRRKVFRTGICPSYLDYIGREIVKRCEGLPLVMVIASGLVKNQLSYEWWSEIAGSLRSFLVHDPSQYIDTLALSYNHLPPHLRPCFLFIGVFPEDYDIPVKKLIWLWIAQGFIHQTGSRTLEDIGENLLMDLITRSLLMATNDTSGSQIKTCRLHDLLRDFCLKKIDEGNIDSDIYRYAPVPASSSIITYSLHGILSNLPAITTHSVPFYPFNLGKALQEGVLLLCEAYKFLRILDVESIYMSVFPSFVIQLGNLRYLAIQAHDGSPQASISNLVNLQMLIILSRKNVVVPKTIWNMVNLRHLYIKSGVNLIEDPCIAQGTVKDGCPRGLASLQTLSQLNPKSCDNILANTPNLRKLGFCGPLISSQGDLEFPSTGSLQKLENLKLLNTVTYPKPTRSCNPIMFPEILKKLTLSNIGMDWEEMWTFSLLPNLEILKLKFNACIGERWETSNAEFGRLKILKLQGLELREWVCSRDNFPRLQSLVVHRCLKLISIPLDVGRILTLDVIEVRGCSMSAKASALKIKEEQKSEGNCFLKVHATNII